LQQPQQEQAAADDERCYSSECNDASDVAIDGPESSAQQPMMGNDIEISELQVEDRDVRPNCITVYDGDNSKVTELMKEELETKVDIISDRPSDSASEMLSRCECDLDATTDEPQEACVDKQNSTLVEMADGGFIQHSGDESVDLVYGPTSELEANRDVDNDDSSNKTTYFAKETEIESAVVENLPNETQLGTSAVEIKTHTSSVSSSEHNECDAVTEVPVVIAETELNAVSEYLQAKFAGELADKADSGVSTCVRNLNIQMPVSVSDENILSEVNVDSEPEAEDSPGTEDSSVAKCWKEMELVDDGDKPAINCSRNINTEASVDVSNTVELFVTDADIVNENDLCGVIVEDSEFRCSTGTQAADMVLDEHVSSEVNADPLFAAETSESMIEKPDTLLSPQPAVNVSDQDSTALLKIDHQQVMKSCTALPCTELQETEMEIEVYGSESDKQLSAVASTVEQDEDLLKLPETIEPVVEEGVELLQQSGNNSTELVLEHDISVPNQPYATEPVEEESGLLTGETSSSESVVGPGLDLLKQFVKPVKPVVEEAAELQDSFKNGDLMPKCDRKLSKPASAVETDYRDLLKQLNTVDSVIEDDGEIIKQGNSMETAVGETGETLKLSSSIRSVLERDDNILKESETVQDVVRQHENVEFLLHQDRDFAEQPNNADSVDSVLEHDGELLQQSEPVVEDAELLLKQCDNIELIVEEDRELSTSTRDVDLVLEHDTESMLQYEVVAEVVECGGELLKPLYFEGSITEHNMSILQQSDNTELVTALESQQLPDHEMMLVSVTDSDVMMPTVTDTSDSGSIQMQVEAAEEQSSAPCVTLISVYDEVESTNASNLSVDARVERTAVVDDQPCMSVVVKQPESTATLPGHGLVSESESEVMKELTVPVSESVVCGDSSQGNEFQLVMPKEKEVGDGDDDDDEVADAGKPLEDLDMRPTLHSALCKQQDATAIMSNGDSVASFLVIDAEISVATRGAVGPNAVEDSITDVCFATVEGVPSVAAEVAETGAQPAVCLGEMCEHEVDVCCSDLMASSDIHATSDDASSPGDIFQSGCNSRTMVMLEELETKEDFVSDRSSSTTFQVPFIVTTNENTVNVDETVQNLTVKSSRDGDAVNTEGTVQSGVEMSTATKETAVFLASLEDMMEMVDKDIDISNNSLKQDGDAAQPFDQPAVCDLMKHIVDAVAAADKDDYHGDDVACVTKIIPCFSHSTEKDIDVAELSEKATICHHKDDADGSAMTEGTLPNGVAISIANEERAAHHASESEDMVQNGVKISAADKNTIIYSMHSVQTEDVISRAEKYTLPTHNTTVMCSEYMIRRGDSGDDDVAVHALGSIDTEPTENVIPTAAVSATSLEDMAQLQQRRVFKDTDVQNESSENSLHPEVMISVTNKDEAMTVTNVEDAMHYGMTVSVVDEDATTLTSNFSGIGGDAACGVEMPPSPADICTTVYLSQTDVVSHFDSQVSDASVEEGQFDDVESDDNVEPAILRDVHRQLCHSSPAFRQCRASSHVSEVHRGLCRLSSSSYTARTPTSYSPSNFSVTSHSTMSPYVRHVLGCSSLLSSPVCQHIDIAGSPGTRLRLPQSPIMPHSRAYPHGAGFQVSHDMSPDVRNTAPAAGRQMRKRKHSAGDADVASKRSLVVDFAGDGRDVISQCDKVHGECGVISAGCDNDNDVTVTGTVVIGTVTRVDATSEKLNSQEESSIVTSLSVPVSSVAADSSSAVASDLDTQTTMSSTVISEDVVHDKGKLLTDTQSVSVRSGEDTANMLSGSLNNVGLNSDAELSERPVMVEDMAKGFLSTNSNVSLEAEEVEGTEINTVSKSVDYLTTKGYRGDLSSRLDEMQPDFSTFAADVDSQLNSKAENMKLAAEHCSSDATKIGHTDDNPAGECTGESQDLPPCVVQLPANNIHLDVESRHPFPVVRQPEGNASLSSIVLVSESEAMEDPAVPVYESVVCDDSSGSNELHLVMAEMKDMGDDNSYSLSTHISAYPVGCVADASETDNELSDTSSVGMNMTMTADNCVAHSSQVTPNLSQTDLLWSTKPECNRLVTSCTQGDMFSCITDVQLHGGALLEVESESCNSEMQVSVTDTVDMLTASFTSHCMSQAANDVIFASQATNNSIDCDVLASQCMSQTPQSEISTPRSCAVTKPDTDDLHLFLEMSQKPSTMDTSFHSQEAEKEDFVSSSQMSDVGAFHLYLEPSQEPNSLEMLSHKKSRFSEDVRLSEREDAVSTDGENSLETDGESDVLMEFRERGISSQSTIGGLDHETAGEEELAASELAEDKHCVWKGADGLRLECSHYETESLACQESGRVDTCGGDEIKESVDRISIESDLTDKPCESVVINSYDALDEFSSVERMVLSAIVEEEKNVTEGISDADVADKIEWSGDKDVTELHVNADASLVTFYAIVHASDDADDNEGKSAGDVSSDLAGCTSAVACDTDENTDAAHSLEKDVVCALAENDIHPVAAADDVDCDSSESDSACMVEIVSQFDCSTEKDVYARQLSVKAAVCSPAKRAADTAAANITSDDNEDDGSESDVTGSISDSGSNAGRGVDLMRSSENAAAGNLRDDGDDDDDDDDTESISDSGDKDVDFIRSSEKAACSDDDDDDDDKGDDDSHLDDTESMPDAGSDVARLSGTEEHVQSHAHDSVSSLSHHLIQLPHPGSDGDEQFEEPPTGKYCSISICFVHINI